MGLNVHDDIYNYLAAVQEEEFKKDYLESKMVDCIVSRNGGNCQKGDCKTCFDNVLPFCEGMDKFQLHLLVNSAKETAEEIIEQNRLVEEGKLRQGSVPRQFFFFCKNISDRGAQIHNSIYLPHVKNICVENYMNEPTYFYFSRGYGVKTIRLEPKKRRTIGVWKHSSGDIEYLIGNPQFFYSCNNEFDGSTWFFRIFNVSKTSEIL